VLKARILFTQANITLSCNLDQWSSFTFSFPYLICATRAHISTIHLWLQMDTHMNSHTDVNTPVVHSYAKIHNYIHLCELHAIKGEDRDGKPCLFVIFAHKNIIHPSPICLDFIFIKHLKSYFITSWGCNYNRFPPGCCLCKSLFSFCYFLTWLLLWLIFNKVFISTSLLPR
jgi:hypothetical protein